MSLFSGCGGCSLGLKQAGYEIALGAELDPDACESYRVNVSPRILKSDLASVGTRDLFKAADVAPSELDLLIAGPPCQSFTSAGSRDWNDVRNLLLHRTVDLIAEARPPWVVIENVEGLLTAQRGYFFIETVLRLLELGYWVSARKVYMEAYGVPQRRKRVMIVANQVRHPYVFPEAIHADDGEGDLFGAPSPVSVMEAIEDLGAPSKDGLVGYSAPARSPFQTELRNGSNRVSWHRSKAMNETTKARIQAIKQGQTMRDLPDNLQHPSFKRRALRRVMDGTPTEKRGGAPSGLKRLLADEPSLTITSAAASEFIHPLEDRLLSLRECARLQTFPDEFEFEGGWSSVATQIGNAIPPSFMRLLASDIATKSVWADSAGHGRWLGISASKSAGHSPALTGMLAELDHRTRDYVG